MRVKFPWASARFIGTFSTGFWINGHHLKLHGWGQRPTDEWPGLGTAQPDWLHYYTLQLMKEAGGNFIRWGHSAGGPEMIRAGDELGIIADQPGVDGESDTVGAAWDIRAAAFRDLLIYFRNDPSILIWEGGNQKVTRAHAQELSDLVKQYDPHGGRAYSQRRADETTGAFMDVTIGTEGSHEVPRLPVVEGEYDREESPRRVWDDFSPPEFGYPEAKGQTYDLTSEQFAVNEVGQYVRKVGAASDCGGANWIFSDSTSGGRNTAEVDRASGEVDGVRLPKEAYYVCQTMFRNDPQVHIIGHWNYPAGTKKTVYVTSNCQDVELFVNGKSLGHGEASNNYLFTFTNIMWEPGEIKAVAFNQGAPAATNSIRTAGPPVALRLTPVTGPGGLQADGSDVALVDVEAVDAEGERCPTFQKRVDFTCSGPAVWRGGYDSGEAGSINKLNLDLECGINRVAVRATLKPGKVLVTANCPGLRPASLTIVSHSFPVTEDILANRTRDASGVALPNRASRLEPSRKCNPADDRDERFGNRHVGRTLYGKLQLHRANGIGACRAARGGWQEHLLRPRFSIQRSSERIVGSRLDPSRRRGQRLQCRGLDANWRRSRKHSLCGARRTFAAAGLVAAPVQTLRIAPCRQRPADENF